MPHEQWEVKETNVFAKYRRQKGYTQDDIAERMGRSKSWVSKFENGQYCKNIREFLLYCHILDVNVETMLYDLCKGDLCEPLYFTNPNIRHSIDSIMGNEEKVVKTNEVIKDTAFNVKTDGSMSIDFTGYSDMAINTNEKSVKPIVFKPDDLLKFMGEYKSYERSIDIHFVPNSLIFFGRYGYDFHDKCIMSKIDRAISEGWNILYVGDDYIINHIKDKVETTDYSFYNLRRPFDVDIIPSVGKDIDIEEFITFVVDSLFKSVANESDEFWKTVARDFLYIAFTRHRDKAAIDFVTKSKSGEYDNLSDDEYANKLQEVKEKLKVTTFEFKPFHGYSDLIEYINGITPNALCLYSEKSFSLLNRLKRTNNKAINDVRHMLCEFLSKLERDNHVPSLSSLFEKKHVVALNTSFSSMRNDDRVPFDLQYFVGAYSDFKEYKYGQKETLIIIDGASDVFSGCCLSYTLNRLPVGRSALGFCFTFAHIDDFNDSLNDSLRSAGLFVHFDEVIWLGSSKIAFDDANLISKMAGYRISSDDDSGESESRRLLDQPVLKFDDVKYLGEDECLYFRRYGNGNFSLVR